MTEILFRDDAYLRFATVRGAHVARTGEIGYASVTQIEKKGKVNRRVRIALASP